MTPHFTNTVKVEWLQSEARDMLVLETLSFLDAAGYAWVCPENAVVDGASIPRFFWRFIGSPFIGKYRRASVIHDVYCTTKELPHDLVHRMFYEAMITDGVPYLKAKAMYNCVKWFGPKW